MASEMKSAGKLLLELLLVFKRIMPLRERHGAGIIPAVDDLVLAVHLAAALRAGERHVVDVRAVQLDVLGIDVVGPALRSSSREPMTCTWPHSQTQTGSGVPQ